MIREQHLDFIRGFAIICVLIYHLDINFSNFKVFSGGYLGVDIFFVLSGYLITKISIEKKRNILKNISSRLRRLLPALLLMILITIIYASIFYMPQNLINVSYSSIFSSLFLSNLYFYRSIQIYGDESQFSSLIHTWSLSVEMQIYIFFFISLFFFNKKSHFKIYIIIVFFLSLLITFFLYDERKLFSFYSPVTRLIEFLTGSLTFLYYSEFKKLIGGKINIFFILSLIVILFFLFYSDDPMPNIINLIVVFCTVLLILNRHSKLFYEKNLIKDCFIFFGKISYSLYLFHFPIFLFVDNIIVEKNYINGLLKLLISISFSVLSYNFIEKKFNDVDKVNNKKFIIFNLFFFLIIYILSLNAIKNNGYYKKLDPHLKKFTIQNFSEKRNLFQEKKNCHNREKNYCQFVKDNSNRNIYLYGDSHADAISKNLYNKLSLLNLNYIPITIGGTFPGVAFKKNNDNNEIKYVQSYNAKKYLKKLKNQKIIIFSRYSLYLNNTYFDNYEGGREKKGIGKNFLNYPSFYINPVKKKKISSSDILSSFKDFLVHLNNNGNVIYIVYPTPELGFNLTSKVLKHNKFNFQDKISKASNNIKFTTSYEIYKNRNEKILNFLDNLNLKNVKKIKTEKIFCNTIYHNRCLSIIDKKLMYYDYDHLSVDGADILVNNIINVINNN